MLPAACKESENTKSKGKETRDCTEAASVPKNPLPPDDCIGACCGGAAAAGLAGAAGAWEEGRAGGAAAGADLPNVPGLDAVAEPRPPRAMISKLTTKK